MPRLLILILVSVAVSGCGGAYYLQAARGQAELLLKREPIPPILDDPRRPAELKARLRRALAIREYASLRLALPDNDSYRSYVELGRPAAVWNVFAAPEFSLTPYRWCYPLIGCASYRGYFRRAGAEGEAARLQARGYDTFVGAVPAYSTLGWFADPLPSTVIRWPETRLAGLIFHELAHQVVYVRDDTTFNESFASAVERLGVDQWLRETATPERRADHARRLRQQDQFQALLWRYRRRLEARYAAGGDPETLRRDKAALFRALRHDYQRLASDWPAGPYFDGWFRLPLNNARFIPVQDYTRLRDAFVCLRRESTDWASFYRRVRALARLPKAAREARLAVACHTGQGEG